jgi:hypothetical protein
MNEINIEQSCEISCKGNCKGIRVLSIGNSFSVNAHTYLQEIANAGKVDMVIGNLFIGGCSLKTHWNNAKNDVKEYDYFKTGQPTARASIKYALLDEKWDYVTFQQVSGFSGIIETYYPYLTNLAEYVKRYVPAARHVIHQTWAYEQGCEWEGFKNYDYDQQRMFAALKSAYKKAAESIHTKFIIPVGEAFQMARATQIGDTLCCEDKAHAGIKGNYLAGAVWYEMFTGKSILENSFTLYEIPPDEMLILKQVAHDAVRATPSLATP